MSPTLEQKLERLKHYHTRYELIATNGDRRVLIGYSHDRSRRAVLECCRKRGNSMVALARADNLTFAKRATDGATIGAWTIRFSGRTQREAYIEGELPYVGDLHPEVSHA